MTRVKLSIVLSILALVAAGILVLASQPAALTTKANATTTNTTTTTTPIFNATMPQNATCVAAEVHILLSKLFYSKVYALANATGEAKLVNSTLAKALNMTNEAEKYYSEGLCFTALKDAIAAIHEEQDAWSMLIRTLAKELHYNVTQANRALAMYAELSRKLEVAYRFANATGNKTLAAMVNELLGNLTKVKQMLESGNFTGALKLLKSLNNDVKSLLKQVHENEAKWAKERAKAHHAKASHGTSHSHGKGK